MTPITATEAAIMINPSRSLFIRAVGKIRCQIVGEIGRICAVAIIAARTLAATRRAEARAVLYGQTMTKFKPPVRPTLTAYCDALQDNPASSRSSDMT